MREPLKRSTGEKIFQQRKLRSSSPSAIVDTKLVPAFLGNDPYYPRPQIDEKLWEDFCGRYLKACEVMLGGKRVYEQVRGLPRWFLDEVSRVSREQEDRNEEDNVVFAD